MRADECSLDYLDLCYLLLCRFAVLAHVLVTTDACYRSPELTGTFPSVGILIHYDLAIRKVSHVHID